MIANINFFFLFRISMTIEYRSENSMNKLLYSLLYYIKTYVKIAFLIFL